MRYLYPNQQSAGAPVLMGAANAVSGFRGSLRRFLFAGLPLAGILLFSIPGFAQQQFQGVCAQVKIIIAQELTLERIGFEATLEITNNDGEDPITDFFAALTFENPDFSTNGVINDASSLFFVQRPTFQSINAVGGDGVIAPTAKAIIKWFIIPKISAGGTFPDGVRYRIGCQLAGKLRAVTIPAEIMVAIPATIYVKPEPQLEISYFQPRDVQGDDPFTPEVETPVPFTVGVLVKNSGYGLGKKIKIDSQQPKIVENKQNLLLIAQLLGARVSDQPVPSASLTVDFGDIPPGQTRKGAWDMITSLSGEFVEFKASYTHASELGGLETSVIKSLNAYFISHEVLNDQPGRDSLKDFLAISDNNPNLIPNALYESEGNVLPVNYLTNTAVLGSAGPGGSFQVSVEADKPGWCYMRLSDPGQAKLPVFRVVRSDGKVLNPNNYWTNVRYSQPGNNKQTFLNLFDLVDLRTYTYTITYAQIAADTTAPVTTMRFAGSVSESGGKYYVTPETQIYFTSEDASPVSMFYSLTNGPFSPALPFSLSNPGEFTVVFYAQDSFGNREGNKTNLLVVSGSDALNFASILAPDRPMFAAGDALSIRPANAGISFQATSNPSRVDAHIDVFQRVIGWASVSGVPSSPTASSSATLNVGGTFVFFYRFRLDGGAWSPERSVTTPIALTGLGGGPHVISVMGRSQYGYYPDSTNAVTVSWVVSGAAPATVISGAPATPTRNPLASLSISGAGVTAYKWTINNGYYRPETLVSALLPVTVNAATQQLVTISVLGKTGSVFQPTNSPTTATWKYDPFFGYPQTGLARVRSLSLTNIGTAQQSFAWDGKNDSGAVLPQGWYTVRVTLADQLGRTNFATRLVQLGDIAGSRSVLADALRGPSHPYARGPWAVWQDQASGNWEIYAQNLSATLPMVRVTTNSASQENPQTDGRYVVWQGRQANGNWDIFLRDLSSNGPVQALTGSTVTDEINPAIEWPWVVYQRRTSGDASAPWQLVYRNLDSNATGRVSPSTQDQLNPDIQDGRVVWQDWRDVGPGEIYFKNLETGVERRLTTNSFGQYHPAVHGQWVVWQDNRHGQVDLYGFDFLREKEVRITATPENETQPFLDGPWLSCLEDSLGSLTGNLRLVHLPTLAAIPVTRSTTAKQRPALSGSKAVWLEVSNNVSSVVTAEVPALQAVFQNRNAVVVTDAMASHQHNAYSLLALWHSQAGVQQITRYTSLVPDVVSQTVGWTNGAPSGPNFALTPGTFLWVNFPQNQVLDLGADSVSGFNLASGANVISYTGFPSGYSAYELLRQLGQGNARAVRMLDSQSGRWVVTEVVNGQPIGPDFVIPRVAVLMLDVANPVANFRPQ
ncbi:MAG TPA: FlgD immunoglobulin-like domain containing protein [Clostridia bacterium]|nr:FlgD immunoglobulin-like domain containing protein [Clostridia bacterium]